MGVCMVQHEKFQSAPGSRVGTPAYLAPEVILTTKGKTYDGKVMPPLLPCLPTLGCAEIHTSYILYCHLRRFLTKSCLHPVLLTNKLELLHTRSCLSQM